MFRFNHGVGNFARIKMERTTLGHYRSRVHCRTDQFSCLVDATQVQTDREVHGELKFGTVIRMRQEKRVAKLWHPKYHWSLDSYGVLYSKVGRRGDGREHPRWRSGQRDAICLIATQHKDFIGDWRGFPRFFVDGCPFAWSELTPDGVSVRLHVESIHLSHSQSPAKLPRLIFEFAFRRTWLLFPDPNAATHSRLSLSLKIWLSYQSIPRRRETHSKAAATC